VEEPGKNLWAGREPFLGRGVEGCKAEVTFAVSKESPGRLDPIFYVVNYYARSATMKRFISAHASCKGKKGKRLWLGGEIKVPNL